MAWKKVSIEEYKKHIDEYAKEHCKYLDEITAINKEEHAIIDSMECDNEHDKFDEYCKKYPEKLQMYKDMRNAAKEKWGEYSSYYNCPYYCVVTNKKELDELYKGRNKNDNDNYKYHIKYIKQWYGKKIQDECHKDVYGKCIGEAFFIDQSYWIILDEKTGKEKFALCIKKFDIWDHRSYRIVTNGKDYI